MIIGLNLRKLCLFIEFFLSFFLVIFFSVNIFYYFYSQNLFPHIVAKEKTIYLEGKIHIPQKGFLNLIAFDYSESIKDCPFWNKEILSTFLRSHSLILTKYSLKDFSQLLLKLGFPYWEKGGVKLAFKVREKWFSLEDVVDIKEEDCALEDILFLGLGLAGANNIKGISPRDFLTAYFKGKNIKIKKSFLRLKGPVLVKMTVR